MRRYALPQATVPRISRAATSYHCSTFAVMWAARWMAVLGVSHAASLRPARHTGDGAAASGCPARHRVARFPLSRPGPLPPDLPGSGFFFFNDRATTEIYTLSLHDALPI